MFLSRDGIFSQQCITWISQKNRQLPVFNVHGARELYSLRDVKSFLSHRAPYQNISISVFNTQMLFLFTSVKSTSSNPTSVNRGVFGENRHHSLYR